MCIRDSNKTHEHIRTQSTKTYVKPNIPDMSMFQTPKWIIGIAVAFVAVSYTHLGYFTCSWKLC